MRGIVNFDKRYRALLLIAAIKFGFFTGLSACSASSTAVVRGSEDGSWCKILHSIKNERFDNLGFTYLHVAAAVGNSCAIKAMLTQPHCIDINSRTYSFEDVKKKQAFPSQEYARLRSFLFQATPLHIALLYGNLDAATVLLDEGAITAFPCYQLVVGLRENSTVKIPTRNLAVVILPFHRGEEAFKKAIPSAFGSLAAAWQFGSVSLDAWIKKSHLDRVQKSFGDLRMSEFFVKNHVTCCLIKENNAEAVSDQVHSKIVRHIQTNKAESVVLLCNKECCQAATQKELSLKALARSYIRLCKTADCPGDTDCAATENCSLRDLLPPASGDYTIVSALAATAIKKYDQQLVGSCAYLALMYLFNHKTFRSPFAVYVILGLEKEIRDEIVKKITLALRLAHFTRPMIEQINGDIRSFADALMRDIKNQALKKKVSV